MSGAPPALINKQKKHFAYDNVMIRHELLQSS